MSEGCPPDITAPGRHKEWEKVSGSVLEAQRLGFASFPVAVLFQALGLSTHAYVAFNTADVSPLTRTHRGSAAYNTDAPVCCAGQVLERLKCGR